MNIFKVATFFLLVIAVGADKKIELQDIEEDNLRSEKEKDLEKSDIGTPATGASTGAGDGTGYITLDYLKNNLLKYFDGQTPGVQQPRYVHQYAVTEPPERPVSAPAPSKQQYLAGQHPMVGYLANMPMQIYLVPQYYTEQPDQQSQQQIPYQTTGVARVAYQAPEQTQTNYVEVPPYTAPSAAKSYVQQYQHPVAYVTYAPQPTVAPASATVAPVVAYPVVQYTPTIVTPTAGPTYYQHPHHIHVDTNSVDEVQEHSEHKNYASHTDTYHKPTEPEFPRYYNSRAPIIEEYRHHPLPELPHPSPLLLKPSPPHLAHIPKALPMFRPITKPVYQGGPIHNLGPRPHDTYGPPSSFKRRPSSLLDSYIPSSLQVEYLRRGLIKDPLSTYDAVASGRLPHIVPRHYERGFLPNQIYHTAGGGVTYGHYKRAPKSEKVHQK